MCAWMSQLGFCCQSRSSLQPHSGGRTQYLRNTECSLFFHIWHKAQLRRELIRPVVRRTSWGSLWPASISFWSKKYISVEAWTKAFRMSAIVGSGKTGVFAAPCWKSLISRYNSLCYPRCNSGKHDTL